jgi:hypothetical protein
MIYVLSKDNQPLMPTYRYGKVRRMLKTGLAKVVSRSPFTIQLLYDSTTYTQPITLGIDSGYKKIGFSAVTEVREVISGEVDLLDNVSERITERAANRRTRRTKKTRYRKPRFDNRKRQEGTLAPSVQHKLDSHTRLVERIQRILPITKVIVEIGSFDVQKLKNPEIEGVTYQEGEQFGFDNLREYILHRDGHKCKNPKCGNRSKEIILQVHHLGFWKQDRTNRPGNLITLCTHCHSSANHQPKGFLYGWQPKLNSLKPATFMSTVRKRLVSDLNQVLPTYETYGYITKGMRRELGLEKTHSTDAFVIAGGTTQIRCDPIPVSQVRRNSRDLEKFYDAKYLDTRDRTTKSGKDLASGRRTRNKNKSGPNLRVFRGHKLKAGRRSVRTQRYQLQPKCLVRYQDRLYRVAGIQNYGEYIRLTGLTKPVKTSAVTLVAYAKGLVFGLGTLTKTNKDGVSSRP